MIRYLEDCGADGYNGKLFYCSRWLVLGTVAAVTTVTLVTVHRPIVLMVTIVARVVVLLRNCIPAINRRRNFRRRLLRRSISIHTISFDSFACAIAPNRTKRFPNTYIVAVLSTISARNLGWRLIAVAETKDES